MIVPAILLFFGVFGTTLAAKNCCLPVLARSPKSRTVVSFPNNDWSAAVMSSGTAGSAGFAGAADSVFATGGVSDPQPGSKQATASTIISVFRVAPVLRRILHPCTATPPLQGKDGVRHHW